MDKVLLTREEGHNGHRGAFSFQHLVPALQQQGLLPNEVCTVAKTAGSVPQAAKQNGWNSAEGSCAAKAERRSTQRRTHCGPTWHGMCWWQQVGTRGHRSIGEEITCLRLSSRALLSAKHLWKLRCRGLSSPI